MSFQQGPGWLELSEMTEQPDYDLETFVNKAELALDQQAKHFSALQGGCGCMGCGWKMGLCRWWQLCPEGMGPLRPPLTPSVPPPFLPDVIKALRLAMQLEEQASKQISHKKRPQ